jgi:DNA-binding transcriptional LysR family regulator
MMDRLASMAVFVKAADLGSFTAAAAALGLSSQMVGKHVGFLEEHLGAQLLYRTTRRQSLTDVGRAFHVRCRRVLAEAEAADAVVRELSTIPSGRLRINAPATFGSVALAPLVTRYLRSYPGVEIALTLTDRYVDIVKEGYDAVIRLGPLKDSTLTARALTPYQLIACASPTYLAEHGVPSSPEDLSTHECLGFVYSSGLPWSEWRFVKDGKVHNVDVRSRFQVNDARVLRDAALAGCGIALQANLILKDDLAAGRLVRLFPHYETPTRPLHIVFPASRPPTPALRTFVDSVVDAFGRP